MERERGEVDRQFSSFTGREDHPPELIKQAMIKVENKLSEKERSLYQLRDSLFEHRG
jgi:hypothetical protein